MPEFIIRLKKEARFLLLIRWLIAFAFGFIVCSIGIGLLDLYDLFFPIKEKDVNYWLVGLGLFSTFLVLGALVRAWIHRPSVSKLAECVEAANPGLRDSLNAAVEIIDRGKRHGVMEERVLAQMEAGVTEVNWITKLRPSRNFWKFLLLGFAASFLVSIWSLERSPLIKAKGAISGQPGITITTRLSGDLESGFYGADAEFRRGTDVSIVASIHRGHRGTSQAWIEVRRAKDTSTFEMLPTGEPDSFEFIVPALREPIAYRVFSLSLESEWHEITPYDPPELEFARWEIIPPAYLKSSPLIHQGFGYLKAPQNSRVILDVRVLENPRNVGARLLSSDENLTMESIGRVTFREEFVLKEEWSARLELRDLDEPERPGVLHDAINLSPIPDQPPVIEISSPAKDLELPFDADPLLIDLFAADDHGISDIRLHVSHDGVQKEDALFVDPVEKEKSVTGILDLGEYPLAIGDVITYMAFAVDNREPEGQIARSEIYFIEILPPEGNSSDSMDQAGGMDGDTKEIPIRLFINRTKQIIRETYDGLLDDGNTREEKSLQICSDSLNLKHEMTKTYDEFEGRFPIADGIDLGELLNEATYHIEQTEIYTGGGQLEESLESSEQALRKLVQMYALMQEMEKQRAKGEGQSAQSSAEQGKPDENNQSMEQADTPAQTLAELSSQLEQLKNLQERQESLNESVGKAAGTGQTGTPNQEMAGLQEDIRRELEGLRERRYDRSGRLGDVGELDQAGREMKEGAGDLRRDQPGEAQPHGELASDALGRAVSRIEREIAGVAAEMLEALKSQADQLADGQGGLRKRTENAQGGQGERLRGEQEGLNEGIENLLEKMDRTARALGKHKEDATENLLQILRQAREDGIEKSGKQASNALLYDAFSKASDKQKEVEISLDELEQRLQGLEDQLLHGDSTQLVELAEHLQKMQREASGMGEEQFRGSNEEAARLVGNLSDADSDQRLLNLTRMFEESAYSENLLNGRSLSAGAVEQAVELVDRFFWENAVQERLIRNQQATQAPARYRKQVQEYFRRIAEGR